MATEPLVDTNGNPVTGCGNGKRGVSEIMKNKIAIYQPLTPFKRHWRSGSYERKFIFFVLFVFPGPVFACGTDVQRQRMAEKLSADAEMQKFVCGASDSCSMGDFKAGLQFQEYEERFHGQVLSVCLVVPTLTATNSYTGVFAEKNGEYAFQFISYGTGVKAQVNKAGIPMILEYSVADPDNPDYSLNQYLWNGQAFIFNRSVPIHN
ncbi:hypothetical protein M3I54_38055 [Paraburkholderia sp. CNPSo 3274]|uniref:hypothetical protein n=1 Tax=Paraburkholderia sp. CNPSo 3274 TaxID=2940932 RepID=UPI0020B73FED|nr:hypothetical protein [Paraburkholderia sp. CNPSo 3274]MCP3712658.1 hypothetical protein [Paraburkholderia sp. CNPSo 3274]